MTDQAREGAQQRFQVVTLHLSDGREISMLAPVFAEDGGQIASLVVDRISVNPPYELPEGMELTTLEGLVANNEEDSK